MTEIYNNIIELVSQNKFYECERKILNNMYDLELLINFYDDYFIYLNKNTQIIITKIFIKLIYIYPNIFINNHKCYSLFKNSYYMKN